MNNSDSNAFHHAQSPLCELPSDPDSTEQRRACAADTIRNASNLLAVLENHLEQTNENSALWTLVRVVQESLRHALELLEQRR